jgi:DNA-binding beta-propeller fold protein YncE
MDLYVDGVDVTADTVFGRADAGTEVDIWVHGDGSLTATADGSGNWVADFSGITDLTYFSDGGSEQFDSDGDSTGVWWASPTFQVAPENEWVGSRNRWTPGAIISLTIEDGSGVVYSDSQTADSHGNFNFNLWNRFDLRRGHVVTISDGTTTKTHTVIDLYVDGVDVTADTVFGRADAGRAVDIWVHGDGNLTVTADGSGNWVADFSGITDLTYFSDGGSEQFDFDGDSTGVWWANPGFYVSADDGWVNSWNRWTPGAIISLTIEDGSGVVYSDSQTADNHGNFNFDMWQGYLQPGYLVTVSDGVNTKTHTVIDVIVTSIDTDTDQIHGWASPGAQVSVWAGLFNEGSNRWVVADSGGNWTADFSVAEDGEPAFDISEITRVNVNEFDDDGDATQRRFGPPVQQNRGVAVTPIDNHVWVANSGVETVTRLDNDGNVLKVIETGDVPTGVAVDAAGKVWATNLGSDNTVRIDPNAGSDSMGEVDLTVDLGPGASPYNYSDMTGAVVVGSTSPQGFWTLVQDSQAPGFEWGQITWNTEPEGEEPPGTAIIVEARAADTEAGLGGQTFQILPNGEFFSMFGRYIEVRVTLKASPEGVSPVLSDIRIQPAYTEVAVDIKPESCPNPLNTKEKGVLSVAIVGTEDFDVSQVDPATVTLARVSPLRWSVEDSAIPYEPYLGKQDAYDCIEYYPDEIGVFDGVPDLTLKFKAREVVAALGDLSDGDVLVLELEGYLLEEFGGGAILGEDVIIIIKDKK